LESKQHNPNIPKAPPRQGALAVYEKEIKNGTGRTIGRVSADEYSNHEKKKGHLFLSTNFYVAKVSSEHAKTAEVEERVGASSHGVSRPSRKK